MKEIGEALKLESLEEIQAEIKERQDLRSTMVGTLYPAVLTDEIQMLSLRQSQLEISQRQTKNEVEKLAWQIFKDRLGLSFKATLTAEQMKKITDVPDYQQYRDMAEKLYVERQAKQEKAALCKKYKIVDIPASGKRGMDGGAFCLCFVYSKNNGNFVLRGYMREVQEYLKKNYTYYFCNFSLWRLGQNRDVWYFWKNGIGIHTPHRKSRIFKGNDRWKFQVRPYTNWHDDEEAKKLADDKQLWFKRMPKRWIPEFDTL
jgi:hypothetical protein